jgi:hypothetical protein
VNALDCRHEDEVVALVLSRRWPEAADQELRRHAESCAVCRDVVAIAPALRQDTQRLAEIQVPAAGQIWWRSAIRARADAARAAARPMVWLQALTGAGAVGAAVAGVSMMWPRIEGTFRLVMPANGAGLQEALPLLLLAGVGLIAAPIAFYLAVPRD